MDEEELEVDPITLGLCVFSIISLLIVFTMAFEAMEEHLVHSSSKHMRPMISSLFGEMTILGFLSLITFCISEAGILKRISAAVIDDSGEGKMYITELFEKVHYLLFTIMVLFICKVLLLLHLANNTIAEWRKMNKEAQNSADVERWKERYLSHEPKPWWNFSLERDQPSRFFAFLSMRKEFIEQRQSIPPFKPSDPESHLPVNFDYAEYLSICLGNYLAHMIHLPPLTWGLLWGLTVLFFVVYFILDGSTVWVSIFWFLIGLVNLICIIGLEKKGHKILSMLLNPSDFPRCPTSMRQAAVNVISAMRFIPYRHKVGEDVGERQPLTSSIPAELPAWTTVTPYKPPSYLKWWCGDVVSNRHQSLFWLGHMGPELHVALVRLHMLLRSVYIALVLAVFVPLIIADEGIGYGLLYLVLSMGVVVWEYIFVLQDLVTTLCQISCSGMLRHKPTIDDVIRRQKTKGAVRAIMMMTSLVQSTQNDDLEIKSHISDDSLMKQVSQDEINEIASIYDMYDSDSSGEIDKEELGLVMNSLGFALSEGELNAMVAALDTDRDGTISRDEFIRWYIRNSDNKNTDMKQKAREMFALFDKDGSNSIKVSELVDGLQGLKHGLSTDDLVALAHELDENGDGEISLHEFEAIIRCAH